MDIVKLENLFKTFNVKKTKPLPIHEITSELDQLGPVPGDLIDFYKVTNGVTFEWFKIFPIEDKSNIKKTWNSLQRANDLKKSNFLDRDEELFKRFLIFASISGGNCALIDRTDFTIWYEEDDLFDTDLSLFEFIEIGFKEVRDL